MPDPLGLLCSILQLVDTVAKARDYIQDFRDAPKDQKRLLDEIDNLDPLIRKLDRLMIGSSPAPGAGITQEFEEPLNQLKTTMEQLVKKLDLDGIGKFTGRATWSMWGKDDVQQALDAVERYKTLLNAWLALDIWNVTQDISSSISDVAEGQRADHGYIMRSLKRTFSALEDASEDRRIDQNYISKSVRDVARNQERHYDAVKRDEIIQWFSPLNFFPRQADIFNGRQPGTGTWLLEDSTFKKWKSGIAQTVWCRGIPGAGKTVLCAIVVDHLRTAFAKQNIRVAVVYLNHKETETQSPLNVLAAIWRQLVLDQPLSQTVEDIYTKHREQRTRPSLDDTYSAVRSAASELTRVFIIVDALDEYPEQQRNTLLYRLSMLGSNVSLMMTSRPHISINYVISDFETMEIRAAETDIRQYLDGQIKKHRRLSRHVESAPDIRQVLEARIVQGSDGMFLLAKLHVDSLTTKHTVKAVREALNNLPQDLDSTYDEVVARINEQSRDDKKLAWLSLSWITHAKRPLRPLELREALAVESDAAELDPENLLDMDSILSVCVGLVVIDEEGDTIRLVHFTMQNYLEQLAPKEFPHASTQIMTTCMTYLSFEDFVQRSFKESPQALFDAHPFLDYAVEYCFVHARGAPEERIREKIISFLGNCSVWRELWNRTKFPTIPEARLWIAATFQLQNICRFLIKEDGTGCVLQEVSLKGRTIAVQMIVQSTTRVQRNRREYGQALAAAAGRGHDDIVRLLLDHGADVNFAGQDGTALQMAALCGRGRSVQLLIDAGADINANGRRHGTAVCAASFRGHYEIVGLLLELGADIHATGGPNGTALQAAVSAGHEKLARLLLESGADIDDAGGHALREASQKGDAAIVKLLLEYGTDPYEIGANLLLLALSAGHESVAKILIEYEIGQRNERPTDGWVSNALQAASWEGNGIIVKLLLTLAPHIELRSYSDALNAALQGISERRDTSIITPLIQRGSTQQRALVGDGEIVQLLIEHGAEVNAIGPYSSALQKASEWGDTEMVRLLVEYVAVTNAEDGLHTSALQRASAGGHQNIAKILLEHGADVNASGPHGSMLQTASARGHKEIVEILLTHGAKVNAIGPNGTALERASQAGHNEIVKILIEHGGNVNATGNYNGVLHWASGGGHEGIVKFLLEYGADVNATGPQGSALQVASQLGHERIVKILIEHGVDVNQIGVDGSALHTASFWDREPVVKILIDHREELNAMAVCIQITPTLERGNLLKYLMEVSGTWCSEDIVNNIRWGSSALQIASMEGNAAIARLLIAHGADVNAIGVVGSALQTASIGGHPAIVQLLIEHGADVNAIGPCGSALQLAGEGGNRMGYIVNILLQHGADIGPSGSALERVSRMRSTMVRLLRLYEGKGEIARHVNER